MTIASRNFFVSDLDDTLIVRGELPRNSRAELSSLIEMGILFTIASARGFKAALSPLQDVPLSLPVIVHNGSVLIDIDGLNPRIIEFPSNFLREIEILVSDYGESICKLYTNGTEDSVDIPENPNMFTSWSVDEAAYFKEHSIFQGSKSFSTEAKSLIRLVICTSALRAKEVASLLQVFEAWVSCLITESRDLPGYAWLEISPVVATKGHGVSLLAAEVGIPLKKVVYYGDAENDLGAMLRVGEAVAVSNSTHSVQEIANRVIGEAKDGSVVKDIAKICDIKII